MTLRVLTYNVRSLRDDAQAVAEVIRSADPHVVCLQEAPRFLRWRSKCAELARRTGLVVVSGGRPAAANMILSRLSVDVISTCDVLFSPEPRLHRRGMALARLRLGGTEFGLAGTHLDLPAEPRLRHVQEIERAIAAAWPTTIPTILCADTNDDPGSQTWHGLTQGRVDAYEHASTLEMSEVPASSIDAADPPGATSGPRDCPRRRIDAIFVPQAFSVTFATALRGAAVDRASDHRPVLAEVELA